MHVLTHYEQTPNYELPRGGGKLCTGFLAAPALDLKQGLQVSQ